MSDIVYDFRLTTTDGLAGIADTLRNMASFVETEVAKAEENDALPGGGVFRDDDDQIVGDWYVECVGVRWDGVMLESMIKDVLPDSDGPGEPEHGYSYIGMDLRGTAPWKEYDSNSDIERYLVAQGVLQEDERDSESSCFYGHFADHQAALEFTVRYNAYVAQYLD